MSAGSPWPDIDPAAALRALGFPAPEGLEPMSGGWDTALYRFDTADGSRHALRVFRSPDRAESAEREKVALEAAAGAGLPVPMVEAFGQWQDRPAVVLSWCPGKPLVRCVERRPWLMWRLARQLGQLQARIHRVPPPEAFRQGDSAYFLGRVRALDEAGVFLPFLESVGLRWDTFIHGDFHPLNVLSDGRTITAVVDWVGAASADPRVDLAWTTTLLRVAPAPPSPLKPLFKLGRWLFYYAWRRGYESEASPMPDLAPFLAWAGTVFLREALARIDEPQVWATHRDLEAMRRWVARWKRQAGIQ